MLKFAVMIMMFFMSMNDAVTQNFVPKIDEIPNEEIINVENNFEKTLDERNEVDLPILMYHHLDENANEMNNNMIITPASFESHIVSMLEQGYTPVFLEEIIAFVENGEKLPEKPICITFDDGYLSNYEYAFPILKKYNAKANIAIIGATIGATEYKDTNHEIIPHFTIGQAKEMEASGLVSIISHTYDMHQASHLESGDKIRTNAVELSNESEYEYEIALKKDFEEISKILLNNLDKKTEIVAYPYGKHSDLSNKILKELGVKMTLATSEGINKIEKGNLDCLYNLHRYTIHENS